MKQGEVYHLSLRARCDHVFQGGLMIGLVGSNDMCYAKEVVPGLTQDWKTYELSLTSKGTDPKAHLEIVGAGKGTFWLDMVSLFPSEHLEEPQATACGPTLPKCSRDLKPSFVRFPGGCWVEGDTMQIRLPLEGDHRRHFGAADPVQHLELSCHPRTGLSRISPDVRGPRRGALVRDQLRHVAPRERADGQMQEFVQDALDAIEYCNGPADSTWGSVRARNGHPAPFGLKYMEIGNENGGRAYQERYALFYDAIKKRASRDDPDRQRADHQPARRRGGRALLLQPRILHPAGRAGTTSTTARGRRSTSASTR